MSMISAPTARLGVVALLVVGLAGCAAPAAEPAVEPAPVAAEPTPVTAEPTPTDEKTCSPAEAADPASFTATNATERDITILWYTFECTLESYITLEPGQAVTLETYVGHNWVALPTDEDTVVSELTAAPGANDWLIEETP